MLTISTSTFGNLFYYSFDNESSFLHGLSLASNILTESFLASLSVLCYFNMVIIENVITQALIQTAGVRSTRYVVALPIAIPVSWRK